MAKLSDLIPTLAGVLGIPDTAVEGYAKSLRKGGMISSGGRGPGGALMTPRDCARLLFAILEGRPTSAVLSLEEYEATRRVKQSGDYSATNVTALTNLPECHSFIDALEALIAATVDGSILSGLVFSEGDGSNMLIFVKVHSPGVYGAISMWPKNNDSGNLVKVEYSIPFPEERTQGDNEKQRRGALYKYGSTSKPDLMQYREVTTRTILALANLLKH